MTEGNSSKEHIALNTELMNILKSTRKLFHFNETKKGGSTPKMKHCTTKFLKKLLTSKSHKTNKSQLFC